MSSEAASQAEVVVQRQLEAYNRRDLEALVACYAAEAQQFEHPDKVLASGVAQIKQRTAVRFQEPNLHARLLNRIVMGSLVVDHERVARTFADGPGSIELLAIYEIDAGKIVRQWVRFGEKRLEPQGGAGGG